MRWSNVDISFGPHDHPDIELYDRNLLFVVKLLIGAAQCGQNTDQQWGLIESYHEENLHRDGPQSERLDSIHDTFHGVILGQLSTPIGCINLEVSFGIGNNKHEEVLMFEVASFDIGYNWILERSFLLMFMAVIHTAYATLKMPGPRA
jgi:hypothetical protein